MAAQHEYRPAPGSCDEFAACMPDKTRFIAGGWHLLSSSGSSTYVGWSELSVKLALLGLNPPVLQRLSRNVIEAHNAKR